eukprot:Lithocolla_globosa_v1_NODE_986_length_2986_cov_12.865575.p2 type:complete len:122 gc:universal NODE_986_length_2986_cov_12.865575:1534-1169(-)
MRQQIKLARSQNCSTIFIWVKIKINVVRMFVAASLDRLVGPDSTLSILSKFGKRGGFGGKMEGPDVDKKDGEEDVHDEDPGTATSAETRHHARHVFEKINHFKEARLAVETLVATIICRNI